MKTFKLSSKKRNQYKKFNAKGHDFLKKIIGGEGDQYDKQDKIKI